MDHGLVETFGFDAKWVGDDCVIADDDLAFEHIREPTVQMGDLFMLDSKTAALGDIASHLAQAIPPETEEHHPGPQGDISFLGNFGVLSELQKYLWEIQVNKGSHTKRILEEDLIPHMMEHHGALSVRALSVAPGVHQKFCSFAALIHLAKKLGIDDAREAREQKRALENVLPNPIEVLYFLEPMMALSPVQFLMPVSRFGSTWVFAGQAIKFLKQPALKNYLEVLTFQLDTRSRPNSLYGLTGLSGMKHENLCIFLEVLVDGLNNLFGWARDEVVLGNRTAG